MKNVLAFPIKHIEDNLIFGQDGTVWAYYQIEGFGYDLLDAEEKMVPFQQQLSFLSNNGYDLHFIIDPTPTDISRVVKNTKVEMEDLDYALKENGLFFMDQAEEALNNRKKTSESSEYKYFLGLQLHPAKNKYPASNIGNNAISAVKRFIEGLNSPVNRAIGLEPYDLLTEDIDAYKNQADSLISSVSNGFISMAKPATSGEMLYITEKTFSVSTTHQDIATRENFTSGNQIEGVDSNNKQHRAVRPKKKAFVDIQNANITEIGPKTLLLSKIINNEVDELFTQYLVCENMEDNNKHPGFEWLYHIQSHLPFSIGISIRAHHQANKMIRKKLSNARLEFKDQRKEAMKGDDDVDLSVEVSEQGAIHMENYFKQTGQPGYACSFVFKVTAKERKHLKTRVDTLIHELDKFGVSIVSPYGEQLNLMMETIPGSGQFNRDYEIITAPGVLAGMMFGATTNIGDNRGFYIGSTKHFNKPVFIKPDLAAKAYDNVKSVFDSISVLVAGMTGKGKSFFMNLFVYLSALTGSQGMIIDPKGDRRGWVDGLPYILKDYISVWTLGSDEKDAGSLDPFRTSTSLTEAKDICMDILSYLANIDLDDDAYTMLSEAVEEVAKQDDPCIGGIIAYLKSVYENKPDSMSTKRWEAVEKLQSTLETLKRNQLANLLFGEVGQNYKVLHTEVPIQVLMVQNLNLPGEQTVKHRPSHKISEAIMISLTAFTKQYMFKTDRMRHKFILQDEASSIERSSTGAELMDFIVRMGRYYNTTLIKGSQNASDHGQDVANLGMKFSFGLRKTEEATEMLNYFNLPETKANIETLKNLGRGDALFQDIYGRSAVIHIDPIFEDLFDAFDSSTATKEDREKEMMRIS